MAAVQAPLAVQDGNDSDDWGDFAAAEEPPAQPLKTFAPEAPNALVESSGEANTLPRAAEAVCAAQAESIVATESLTVLVAPPAAPALSKPSPATATPALATLTLAPEAPAPTAERQSVAPTVAGRSPKASPASKPPLSSSPSKPPPSEAPSSSKPPLPEAPSAPSFLSSPSPKPPLPPAPPAQPAPDAPADAVAGARANASARVEAESTASRQSPARPRVTAAAAPPLAELRECGAIAAPERIVLGGEKWRGGDDDGEGGAEAGPSANGEDGEEEQAGALQGFDTLDAVQRYAVGALSVVLLMPPVVSVGAKGGADLNALAFSRALSLRILAGLGLREGQQMALLALEPGVIGRKAVMEQCVDLVGDEAARFRVVQAMLALAVAGGVYDARSRAFLLAVAKMFRVEWSALAAVELAIAIQLLEEAALTEEDEVEEDGGDEEDEGKKDDFASGITGKKKRRTAAAALADRRRRKMKARKAMKVSGITLVGGLLFGVTGGLIAPALLSALAGVGLASAAGLAGAGTVASGAVVGSLFGVGGMAISGKKAHRRMGDVLDEFDVETKDDERVIEARARRKEREEAKLRKEAERLMALEMKNIVTPESDGHLAVEAPKLLAIEGPMSGFGSGSEYRSQVKTELERAGVEPLERGSPGDSLQSLGGDESDSVGNFSSEMKVERDSLDMPFNKDDAFIAPPVISSLSQEEFDGIAEEGSKLEIDDADLDEFHIEEESGKKGKNRLSSKGRTVGANGLDSIGAVAGLHVCICVPGWLQSRSFGSALDQFEDALVDDIPCSQHVAVRWESRRLYEMSLAFAKFWASKATVTAIQQSYPHALAAASSVAGAVAFAFALPLTVISCLDYIDNPWSILLSRANAAGEALADVLIERSYGQRPVTLVGYSLGARVIFKCLESLAERGALGIVDNVFLLGSPVTADPERWKKVVPVVAGRVVQGYMGMDWALAFFHRGCGHGVYVAGLRRVDCEGVENLDMSLLGMEGHRELKDALPRALRAMGVGSGFITMPPAPLVKRKKSKTRKVVSEAGEGVVVDLGDTFDNAGPKSRLPGWCTSGSSTRESSPAPAYADLNLGTLQLTNGEVGVGGGGLTTGGASAESANHGLNIDLQWGDDVEQVATVAKETKDAKLSGADGTPSDKGSKKKKRKAPKWLSSLGASWTGGSSKKVPSESEAGDTESIQSKAGDSASHASGEDLDSVGSTALPNVPSPASSGSGLDNETDDAEDSPHEDGLDAEDQADMAASGGASGFDWELQRRIWEEQERQLRENGVADADIETGSRVVLGIGVELTGRRLRSFVPQDTELPAPASVDVFTNCIDEQEAVTFRLYEHEKRTKYVPLNALLPGTGKYPKLLGELVLRWSTQTPKGKLRFAISVSVDEAGDVVARAEERLREGGVGETSELVVKRADLCTMTERRELEAAENRRLAAEAAAAAAEDAKKKKLLLQAPSNSDLLALPAPEISDKALSTEALPPAGGPSSAGASSTSLPKPVIQDGGSENRTELTDSFEGR